MSNVPPDLTAICRKAMQSEPADRYSTALEFAEDLRRWLRREPTTVRRSVPRRLWLWARRNKGWAATFLMTIVLTGAAIAQQLATAAAATALAKATAATALAEAQTAREREQATQRELRLQQLVQLRLGTHNIGWSENAWQHGREIAVMRKGDDLRDQMAATLAGFDAHIRKVIDGDASSVAWDAKGERLLVGGWFGQGREHPGSGATIWDRDTDDLAPRSRQGGPGPVAFRKDGTPLQLVADPQDRLKLLLWDVANQQLVRSFPIPGGGKPEPVTMSNLPVMALTDDASILAASATLGEGKQTLVVWESGGKVLRQIDKAATSLAFTPDGTFLAAGDEEGQITIYPLPQGDPVATLPGEGMDVFCLAFHRDVRRLAKPPSKLGTWLLAAGDASGLVTVWDLENKKARAVCRGSHYHVYAVAFSPDGMLLASGGRDKVKLWECATGRLLLDLQPDPPRSWMTGLAFTPDGRRLAVSSMSAFGPKGGIDVFELENGRGQQSLLGLAGQVEKVCFSADGRLLAALSNDCRVGIWDLVGGHLLHVLDGPKILWTDNAALAFSPDGQRFALAGGGKREGHAKLWQLEDGRELGSWTFARGLNNVLAFHPDNKLLLFQMEMKNDQKSVYTVRDLLGPNPGKAITQIEEFDRYEPGTAPADGRFLVLAGNRANDRRWEIKAYDSLTGRQIVCLRSGIKDARHIPLQLDRSGRFLRIWVWHTPPRVDEDTLVEMPSGKMLGPWQTVPMEVGLSPVMRYLVDDYQNDGKGYRLIRRGETSPFVKLGIDTGSSFYREFGPAGLRFAWGTADGTVHVCDLHEVGRRLTGVGLGW